MGSISSNVDKVARADASAAIADASAAIADASAALLRAPFAGVTFGVSGGVLTVTSIYGMAFSRASVGIFNYSLTVPPVMYTTAINQMRSVTQFDCGAYCQISTNQIVFIEGGVPTDPTTAANPSGVLFFEV